MTFQTALFGFSSSNSVFPGGGNESLLPTRTTVGVVFAYFKAGYSAQSWPYVWKEMLPVSLHVAVL